MRKCMLISHTIMNALGPATMLINDQKCCQNSCHISSDTIEDTVLFQIATLNDLPGGHQIFESLPLPLGECISP